MENQIYSPREDAQPEQEIIVKWCDPESKVLNEHAVMATVYRIPPPPEPEPEPEPEQEDTKSSFTKRVRQWLKEHDLDELLDKDSLLVKAIPLLVTILILFFNFLKHRYDLGYYHQVLGVPEEYLNAAWNTSMTDFILYALISIFQSVLSLAGILLLFLFFYFALRPLYIKAKNKLTGERRQMLLLLFVLCFLAFCLYNRIKWDLLLYKIGKPFLLFAASVYGALLLWAAFTLIRRACKKSESKEKDTADQKTDPKPSSKSLIILLVLGLILSGFWADNVGRWTATVISELSYLTADGSVNSQLDQLNRQQDINCWAVLYSKDGNYIVSPCRIDSDGNKAVIYPRYHCVIATEDVVIATRTFDRIEIDGNVLFRNGKWDLWGLWDYQSDSGFKKSWDVPGESIPPETTVPTEPTEPTIPDETTEPTIPDDTTDTSISYEVTELHISSDVTELIISGEITWPTGCCDCCRCTPGLG